LSGSGENKIKNNVVSGNGAFGIFVDPGSDDNTIRDNTLNKNPLYGIVLLEGSTGNSIKKNTAMGNGSLDLLDKNANCDSNTWSNNVFILAAPASCVR
jgi:parallel beta-helix repeat protein